MVQVNEPSSVGLEDRFRYAAFQAQMRAGTEVSVRYDYMKEDAQGYKHRTVVKHAVAWPAGEGPEARTYNGSSLSSSQDTCGNDGSDRCTLKRMCASIAEDRERSAKEEKEAAAAAKAAASTATTVAGSPSASSSSSTPSPRASALPAGVEMKGDAEPDNPGLSLPKDDEWARAQEVSVPGSSALGCETKAMNGWFRMICKSAEAVTGAVVEKGRKATQSKVTIENGTLTIITPYVQGTDFKIRLRAGKDCSFLLAWPAGPRPQQVATLSLL
ncbi:MAG: hypothetical protein U0165_03475 [Polyangiaceae bacterium]